MGQWRVDTVPSREKAAIFLSRNASKFEEGAGFAAVAASPRVLVKEPRGPAGFQNQHTKGSPQRRGGPGRGGRAPGRLLPFRVRGQCSEERQGPGRLPAGGFPSPPQAWDPAITTREPPVSLSRGTPGAPPPPARRRQGWGGLEAGHWEDLPPAPPLGPGGALSFFPPGLLRLGSPPVSRGWGGRC